MKALCFVGFIGFLLFSYLHVVESATGVDVSIYAGMTSDDWECLVKNNYTFAIVECWNGGYAFGSATAGAVSGAYAAGMVEVDVYTYMAPNCEYNKNAADVVTWIYGNLTEQNISYGMLWFDIEQCPAGNCFSSTLSTNVAYMQEAVDTATALGMSFGFYASEYEWSVVMGSDTSFSEYPLWYAHWDKIPSFSDGLYTFGGWTSPYMKQYWDAGPCSCDTDVNYRPAA